MLDSTISANSFVGTWRLISFEARTSSGEVSYPFGRDAGGYLIYGQEGYTAAVMQANRANFTSSQVLAHSYWPESAANQRSVHSGHMPWENSTGARART